MRDCPRPTRVRVVATKAVTAVDGTASGRHEECSAAVFLQKPGRTRNGALLERIDLESGGLRLLLTNWQNLSQQWVPGVPLSNSVDEFQWRRKGKIAVSVDRGA